MTRLSTALRALPVAAALLIAGSAAQSAPVGRLPAVPVPKAWAAVEGMSVAEVMTMARTLPAKTTSPDQPWCDAAAKVHASLADEFGERLVSQSNGVQLWGSDMAGTFTMVMPRGDATACVVASGVGFEDDANPRIFYSLAMI